MRKYTVWYKVRTEHKDLLLTESIESLFFRDAAMEAFDNLGNMRKLLKDEETMDIVNIEQEDE